MVEYLILFLVLVLPFQFALNIGDNFDLAITKVLIPVVFLMWLIRGLAKKRLWVPNRIETWLLIIYLFLLSASMIMGSDAEKGLRKLLYFLMIAPLFWVAADVLQNGPFRKKMLRAIVISGTLAAVLGISQFLLQFIIGLDAELKYVRAVIPYFLGQSFGKLVESNPSWLVNISGNTVVRSFGFFPDPHAFSFFVSLCFFACLGYTFYEKKDTFRIFAIFALFIMFSSIVFSFTRGAYLGMAAGIIFFAVIAAWEKKWLGKGLAILCALILAVAILSPAPVSQRFSSVFDLREGSNAERIKNWKQAAEIVVSHPLFGVGLGNYATQIDPTAGEQSSIYAHNTFLDIAAETGLINGAVFMLLILVSISRFLKKKDALGLGMAAGLVYFLTHGIFDTPIWSPQVLVMFLLILAMGLEDSDSKRKDVASMKVLTSR